MEADSVHALIEKKCSNEEIYVPSQWYEIIKNAKTNDPNYNVIELSLEKIYNFKDLVSKQNWEKNEKKESVGWSKVKDLKVDKDQMNKLHYKFSYDEDYSTIDTKRKRKPLDLKDYSLTNAYTSNVGISSPKYSDLSKLCEDLVIPSEFHPYYDSLQVKKRENDDSQSDYSNEE